MWKYLGEPWWLKYCGFNGRNFSNDTGMNISTHVKLFPPVAFNSEEMLGHAGESVPSLDDVMNRTDDLVANISDYCAAWGFMANSSNMSNATNVS
jgi:hypothetical protein